VKIMTASKNVKSGVCSATFRQMEVSALAALTSAAGLDAIEWGGDVHAPHGDIRSAEGARQATLNAGLEISSYGSYYKILDEDGVAADFQPVLDSALALGADTIRIWAGSRSSEDADDSYWKQLITAGQCAAEQAAAHQVRLAFEFHGNTLTDTNESACALMNAMDCDNVYTYWQPMCRHVDLAYRLAGLDALLPRILNLHVFHWTFDPTREFGHRIQRRPLGEGRGDWEQYFQRKLPEGLPHFALLEFIREDSPAQFMQDAGTLKQWLLPSVA
jgi:sugar phosphate isomerase/epimerase